MLLPNGHANAADQHHEGDCVIQWLYHAIPISMHIAVHKSLFSVVWACCLGVLVLLFWGGWVCRSGFYISQLRNHSILY